MCNFAATKTLKHQKMAEKIEQTGKSASGAAPSPRLLLLRKILAMRCDIEPLSKDNFNEYDKYQYLSHPKILEAVKKQQQEKNVLFRVVYAPQYNTDTRIGFESVFIDMDTECEIRNAYAFSPCDGQRERIKGDGALWTYAEKYITRIEFGIQAEDDPDSMPQQKAKEHNKDNAQASKQQEVSAPSQQEVAAQQPTAPAKAPTPLVKYGEGMYGAAAIESAGVKMEKGEISSGNIITSAHFVFSVAKGLYSCMSDMPEGVRKVVEDYKEACVKLGVLDAPSKKEYEEKITEQGRKKIEEIIDFYNNFSRK